jgi:hypothetical protein
MKLRSAPAGPKSRSRFGILWGFLSAALSGRYCGPSLPRSEGLGYSLSPFQDGRLPILPRTVLRFLHRPG